MWSEHRAAAAQRQLDALATRGPADVDEMQAAAIAIVRRVVPFDAACWATVDPETMLFTGSMTVEFAPTADLERRFLAIESGGGEPNTFRDLAATRRPVARLSDAGPAAVEASRRLRDIWAPFGIGHELRAAFTAAGRCWGVGGMLRSADSPDFADVEVQFVAAAAPAIALAMRSALLRRPADAGGVDVGPAVLVLDARGEVRSATPAAAALVGASAQLGGAAGRLALGSLRNAVLRGAAGARARLRDERAGWLVLQASRLDQAGPDDGEIVVTIVPAAPRDVTGLVLDAHGISAREREVCDAVLAGRSTAEIAAQLFISAHTVQDHLKSIFAKTGVRSRRELAAYVGGMG